MKKYLLLLCLFACPLLSRAQPQISAWYDFVSSFTNAQVNGGFDLQKNFYNFSIFPDTTVKIIFINSITKGADPQYNNWCSLGNAFDPTDSIFSLDGDNIDAITPNSKYTVDSVAYFYTYKRMTNSKVVDTLIFQAKKLNNFYVYKDVNHEVTGRIGTVDYNPKTALAANMDLTIKIPLKEADTSNNLFKAFVQKIGITCNAGEFIATTMTFKPGMPYSKGDTLTDFDQGDLNNGQPVKKMNVFGLLVDYDINGIENQCLRPNNGILINRQQRYLNTWYQDPNEGPKYLVAERFGSTGQTSFYPRTSYKVTGFTGLASGISNNASQDNFSLGNAFPNPVTGKTTIIPLTLNQTENITIDITDMLGRKVMNVASGNFTMGNHRISVNTEGLKPGVYFYTIIANGYSQTKKFTIAH